MLGDEFNAASHDGCADGSDTAISVSAAVWVASPVVLQLYDLAGLYFRAFYALPASIVGPHGRPMNAVRGTVDMLAGVIAAAGPAQGVACLDADWRPAWRVTLIPSYKTHRVAAAPGSGPGADDVEAVPDELAEQVPVILDVLAAVGIAVAGAAGCEADDVIGTLVETQSSTPIEIVSGDRDLFQLIRSTPAPVTVRYIGAGMARATVTDEPALADRYGVDGPGYAAMATLRGDPSDGLPGVPGIGEKTAARLVAEYGSVDALIDAAANRTSTLSPTVRRRISDATDYLRAAVQVVAVRRDAAIDARMPTGSFRLPREPHDPGRLASLVRDHGIGTAADRLLAALAARGR